ncbi:MAG: hypothetical protein ACKJSG_18825 [Lentisphaeria bacterium]
MADVIFKPGFPGDLAVRPAHALQLDMWVTERNFIDIWLPEGVLSDDNETEWFLLREFTDLRWQYDADGGWRSCFEKPGHCSVLATATSRDDGVDLRLQVTNLSDRVWPRTRAPVCVQLAAAPDFRDPALERTCFVAGGSPKAFRADQVERVYPGGCHFYGNMAGPRPTGDVSEIRVASRCGRWHLAHGFETADGVGGNCHESICCIHADPLLGELQPGQCGEATGWIRLRREPG